MKIIYGPIYGTSNPASVDVRTGDIYVNTLVWFMYSDFEKRAILAHERWHYITHNTTNEIACDNFAFNEVAGTEKNSLIQYIDLIRQLSGSDTKRYCEAQRRALIYAASKGSEQAIELLKLFN